MLNNSWENKKNTNDTDAAHFSGKLADSVSSVLFNRGALSMAISSWHSVRVSERFLPFRFAV
ncbi:hypothetical protein BFAG_04106 [Bacteroides fragilis 3_1_12]|uniref:Uncharacterized protein n=1 Tax=Bacteroides fragilis 3_1_12 TaxID=457424 RepID=A0ABN0BR28_BACFG|nr:hypothetical protein BFAG_04106 [Bacteroides fragilis 3_1_12]